MRHYVEVTGGKRGSLSVILLAAAAALLVLCFVSLSWIARLLGSG